MSEAFLGEIRMFAGNFAPRDWAFCEGQLLSISEYEALFSLLGDTYGGDARSTFGLPDLRGRAPMGVGTGHGLQNVRLGEMDGLEQLYIQQANLPSVSTTVSINVAIPAATTATQSSETPSAGARLGPAAYNNRGVDIYTTDAASTTLDPFPAEGQSSPLGSGAPINNRGPSLGMNFIICIQNGLYPPRS